VSGRAFLWPLAESGRSWSNEAKWPLSTLEGQVRQRGCCHSAAHPPEATVLSELVRRPGDNDRAGRTTMSPARILAPIRHP